MGNLLMARQRPGFHAHLCPQAGMVIGIPLPAGGRRLQTISGWTVAIAVDHKFSIQVDTCSDRLTAVASHNNIAVPPDLSLLVETCIEQRLWQSL